MILLRLHWCLCAIATLAMVAGASGDLSPALSTGLWVPSLLVLACDPTSPVRRAVGRGLHADRPPAPAISDKASRTDRQVF